MSAAAAASPAALMLLAFQLAASEAMAEGAQSGRQATAVAALELTTDGATADDAGAAPERSCSRTTLSHAA